MKKSFLYNTAFRLVAPVFHGVVLYILVLMISGQLSVLVESYFSSELYVCLILSFLVFESNRLSDLLFRKWSPKSLESIWGMAAQLLVNTGISVLLAISVLAAYFFYVLGFTSLDPFGTELMTFGIGYGVTSMLYTMIYFSSHYLSARNETQLESEIIQKESVLNDLHNYLNEVNPSLLYSGLESLISLVHHEPQDAEDFIDRLSLVYRYILSNKSNELIDLKSDLKAGSNILFLFNEFHNGQIIIDNKIPDHTLDSQVVPGTTPRLIEFIINKTIISRYQPLTIRLEIEEGYIVFAYKLNDRLMPDDQNLLHSLERAYEFFSEKPVVHIKAYGEGYIKIPLVVVHDEILA